MIRSVIACVALTAAVASALPLVAFRLDDVQCGYKQVETMAIMDAFLRNGVALTLGLITAPPLNYQGNYDCHMDDLRARKASFAAAGVGLEFASHSVTHDLMTTMTPLQQFIQLNDSKVHIEQQLGVKVATFFPPTNAWNQDTITQMVAAGYTIVSDQCGAGQMNAGSPDDSCIVNKRRDIAKPYFQPIDGIVHASVGAQAADVVSGIYLQPSQLLEQTTNCATDYCTIYSQVNAVPQYTTPAVGWGIFMLHGFEFPNTTAIDAWADALLPQMKLLYTTTTIKGLAEAISGTNLTPNGTAFYNDTSSTTSTSSSTGSASTGSTTTRSSTGGTNVLPSSSTGTRYSSSTGSGNGAASIAPATVWITAIIAAVVAVVNNKL